MRMHAWAILLAVTAAYLSGCNRQQAETPYGQAEMAPVDHDHHHHEGPHGGHVVELTDDHSVHGEFVIDTTANVARFYVLGEDLQTPVEATAVTMHVEGQDGEEVELAFQPVGGGESASEFTIPLDQLPTHDIEQLHAHFHVTVEGEELHGDLSHDHDHHHDH
jgi:hypothetical protein